MKPTLVILAAGMGSRYGSMKQTESFGPSGETITDYSIYDAARAGFGKILFVISPKMEEEFVTDYVKKFPSNLEIDYVLQSVHTIPGGFQVHPERVKPWGTAHAVLMAKDKIPASFAVINADDFYGRTAYTTMCDFLVATENNNPPEFGLAGYPVLNTLSEHGAVSRGVCKLDKDGYLTEIYERTKILKSGGRIVFTDEGFEQEIPEDSMVSMNLFGFSKVFFEKMGAYFKEFLQENSMNPKAEIYLPLVVQRMIDEGVARTKVLRTDEQWFGVTYKEDRPHVLKMLNKLITEGAYPDNLWG